MSVCLMIAWKVGEIFARQAWMTSCVSFVGVRACNSEFLLNCLNGLLYIEFFYIEYFEFKTIFFFRVLAQHK